MKLLLLLLLSTALGAADPGKRYLSLKDDAGLFVGEGVAEIKEFKDDGLKALQAAKDRAAAALASAVRVRVKAEFKEESDSAGGETLTSKTESLADVVLEGVRFDDFVDFPEKGRITVLAHVTKLEYRRTLAGKKVPVYTPELGLKINANYLNLEFLQGMIDQASQGSPFGADPNQVQSTNNSPNVLGLGLDLMWRGWVLGLDLYMPQVGLHLYGPETGTPGLWHTKTSTFTVAIVHLQYEYTPWPWRVQPYLPVGVEYAHTAWQGYSATGSGAFGGLGLRYWPNDSLALDLSFKRHFGLDANDYKEGNGKVLQTGPADTEFFKLTGYDVKIGVQWSGF